MIKKTIITCLITGVILLLIFLLIAQRKLISSTSSNPKTIALMQMLNSKYTQVSEISEDDQKIEIKVNKWQVIFSTGKDLDIQVRALQEISAGLRMDRDNSMLIDLRFNKAIVKQI